MKGVESVIIFLATVLLVTAIIYCFLSPMSNLYKKEGFSNQPAFKSDKEYVDQVKLLTDKFEGNASGKRPVIELIRTEYQVPEPERILVNYHALACRFPGFLGPFPSGYMDPEIGIQTAISAGCRVFVLDIDYIKDCSNECNGYFPRLAVRDIQGKYLVNAASNKPLCNNMENFELRRICKLIHDYGFASSSPQGADPIIIVLYFHRRPPGSYKSKTVLDYYSLVAKALSPFRNRLLLNELEGGKFYRHQQEGNLLMKKITDYTGRVLIFNNANTSGFSEVNTYSSMDDLDFLTNLRLFSNQTKMGITEAPSGSTFGLLQTTEDFMTVPDDRKESVQGETTLKWTITLSSDPMKSPTKDVYDKLATTYGVQCVPTNLFDKDNLYLFEEKTFKKYGFYYKPDALRYRKPPVVVPGEPNTSMNARQGRLVPPSL